MASNRKPKATQPELGNGSLSIDASPLVSGAAPRAHVEPFKPTPKQQPRLFSGDLLPPVEIPRPKPRKKKRVPKQQLPLMETRAGYSHRKHQLQHGWMRIWLLDRFFDIASHRKLWPAEEQLYDRLVYEQVELLNEQGWYRR